MLLWQRYLGKILKIVPLGAVGATVLLGSLLPSEASDRPPNASQGPGVPVSERLAAIRQAVFVANEAQNDSKAADFDFQRVWWGNRWNNGGFRNRPMWQQPRWNNWRNNWNNWNNWWRNW